MNKLKATIAICLSLLLQYAWSIENSELASLTARYKTEIERLNIPSMALGYIENLNNIKDIDSRNTQSEVFTQLKLDLTNIRRANLSEEDQYAFDHLRYRIDLHLQRLALENKFKQIKKDEVSSTSGIYRQPFGKEWYVYFLRHWLSVDRTPEWLMELGEKEVGKVRSQLNDVIKTTGYGEREMDFYRDMRGQAFYISDEKIIIEGYRNRETTVKKHLSNLFLFDEIPQYSIEAWPNSNKDTPPARVMVNPKNIFQYGFYLDRHNRQDMDFIYLHEAVPGHLYAILYTEQFDKDQGLNLPAYAYHGLSEGWGAYAEELGSELGLYASPYDLLGKLNFDLVRSVRVVLDVGINYFGWDNEKALTYWHSKILGQDDIAQREIDRVRRWPGQAISYKVGAELFVTLKKQAQDRLGDHFDVREFHHQILGFGSVPLFLVEQRINNYIATQVNH